MEEGLTRTEKTPEVVVVTHDKGLAIERRTSCQDNAVKDNIALGDIKFDSIHENVKVKKIMSNGTNVATNQILVFMKMVLNYWPS